MINGESVDVVNLQATTAEEEQLIDKLTPSTKILTAILLTAVALGLWGWGSLANELNLSVGDVIYRSIAMLPLSDDFLTSNDWMNDWRVEVSRWLGLFAFLLGIFKIVTSLLSEKIQYLKARIRKGHVIIVGGNSFALSLIDVALKDKLKITLITTDVNIPKLSDANLYIVNEVWSYTLAKKFNIEGAKSVTISVNDDAKAIAIARQIRIQIPDENLLMINVVISSPWIAMRIDDIKGVKGIKLISQTQSAVRTVHQKHPPFLLAQKYDQKQIHAVIFGFGKLGEAVLIDLLLSCLTSYLKKPIITIVDPRAKKIQSNLKLRYPSIEESIDLNFVEKSIEGKDHSLDNADLEMIYKIAPITACYICLSEETLSISAGLAVKAIMDRNSWLCGAIFVRLATPGAIPKAEIGVTTLEVGQIIGFGGLESVVINSGVLKGDADHLAKLMHNAYIKSAPVNKVSTISWEKLEEDKRDSNRRVILHIAAKLSSAGVNIEPWLTEMVRKPNSLNFSKIELPEINSDLVIILAKLEHERWMADRRING